MDFILDTIRSDLTGIVTVGRTLLGGFFVLACFFMYLGIFSSKGANWSGLLFRLILGFVLLQNYALVMDSTKDIIVAVDATINPITNAADQYLVMSQQMQDLYEQNQQKGFSLALFGKKTLHNLTINVSFIFYAIVSNVMQAIRYTIAGIIYKIGPLLIPFIVFKSTVRIIEGWFRSYVAVISWPILWHIVLSIAVTLSGNIDLTVDGIEKFVMLNFAVCFVLIFTPMIMSSLISGAGIGAAASMAALGAVNKVTEYTKRGGRVATDSVVGGADAAIGSVVSGEYGAMIPESLSGGLKGMSKSVGFKPSVNERKIFKALKDMLNFKKKENTDE
ncbi:MAG: hypothetical protein H6756_02640 [Candidatus Omnitrophica bacterium]|nr:hypothetical protein [Candidatus Omnitrophota bacterium]